jgi:hypothetical protein
MILALGLVVATAACPVVWLLARAWQYWLMVVLTELMPKLHDAGIGDHNGAAPNLRTLTDASRR